MKHLGTYSQNESVATKADVEGVRTELSADIAAARYEANLKFGGRTSIGLTPIDTACLVDASANRLLGFPADRVSVSYYPKSSRQQVWTDKVYPAKSIVNNLVNGNAAINLGNSAEPTANMRTRLDFSVSLGSQETSVLYCDMQKLLVKIQDGGMPNLFLKVSGRKIIQIDAGNDTVSAWDTLADVPVSGWPAWVSIPLTITLGGWAGQTDSRYGDLRLELYSTSTDKVTKYSETKIMAVRLIAPSLYYSAYDLARDNHPYTIDEDAEPVFNAIVLRNSNGQTARIYLGDDGNLMASDPVHGDYRIYK